MKKESFMNTITLDCKGLACPAPVLRCKEAVEKDAPETLVVTVDNAAAKENVTRFLGMKGYIVDAAENAGVWTLTGVRQGAPESAQSVKSESAPSPGPAQDVPEKTVVFITSAVVGKGDDELGTKLMVNFLGTLPELGDGLWRIILLNGGVKLAIPGAASFDKLKALADGGVDILVCGTCLEFFGLLEKKGVGQTTNMLDVVTSLQLATKVIQV